MRALARGFATAAVGCVLGAAAQAALAVPALEFDKVFNARGAPVQSHYAATYRLGAAEHRLEVWRDHDQRLKRRTDDAIETIVVRPAGEVEWSMTVLDLKRRIRTDIARTNLYRIGHFTDWFAQAHALARPLGAYELALLPRAAAPRVMPLAACRWYALTQGSSTSKICWSGVHRVPLVITDAEDRVQWTVTAIDRRPWPDATFAIDDRGFVRNDANQDIQAD